MKHLTLKIEGMPIVNIVYNVTISSISSPVSRHTSMCIIDIIQHLCLMLLCTLYLHNRMVFSNTNDCYKSCSNLLALHERDSPPGYWGSSINYGMSCIQKEERAFALVLTTYGVD